MKVDREFFSVGMINLLAKILFMVPAITKGVSSQARGRRCRGIP